MTNSANIEYPYMPDGKEFNFVTLDNEFMQAAKEVCDQQTGCVWWPTGAVMVKNNIIIARGANSGELQPVCARRENNCPTGTGYEHCSNVCKQHGHAEVSCVNDATNNNIDTANADIYLYGHWWCCQNCWEIMIKSNIDNVYLLKNADQIFTYQKRLEHYESLKKQHEDGEQITHDLAKWQI